MYEEPVRALEETSAVGVLSLSFSSAYFDHQLRPNVGGRAGFRGMRFGLAFRRGVVDSQRRMDEFSSVLENWSKFKRSLSFKPFAYGINDAKFVAYRIENAPN